MLKTNDQCLHFSPPIAILFLEISIVFFIYENGAQNNIVSVRILNLYD